MLAIMLLCSFFVQLSASAPKAISTEDLLDGLGRKLHGEATLECKSLSPAPTTNLITVIAPKNFIVIDGQASTSSSDVYMTFQAHDPGGIVMRGSRFTPSLYDKGKRLETPSGVDILRENGGTRVVARYEYNRRKFCIKCNPEAPGANVAARQFYEALAPSDDAVPLPRSVVFMLEDQVFLASEFMEGMSLEEFLELRRYNPGQYVLDAANFQMLIVFSMLANPEDGRLENYLVRQKTNGRYEIIPIDIDRYLGKEFVDGEVETRVHCAPFGLYNMLMQPLAPEISAAFQMTNRLRMLPRLSLLLDEHRYQLALRTLLRDEYKEETFLGVPLGEGFIKNLAHKWGKITHCLIFAERPSENLAEIFRVVMPERLTKLYLEDPIHDELRHIKTVDAGRNSDGAPPSAYMLLPDYFFSDSPPSISALITLFSGISQEYGTRFAPETVTELGGLMSILARIGRSRFTV